MHADGESGNGRGRGEEFLPRIARISRTAEREKSFQRKAARRQRGKAALNDELEIINAK